MRRPGVLLQVILTHPGYRKRRGGRLDFKPAVFRFSSSGQPVNDLGSGDLNTTEHIGEIIFSIEGDLSAGLPESFQSAKEKADSLRPHLSNLNDDPGLAVSILTATGHVERALGNWDAAAKDYEEALSILLKCPPEVVAKRSANLWTCHGLARLSGAKREDWESAVKSFDKAIEFRVAEQAADGSSTKWGESAGWMNRADALSKIGGESNLEDALTSLDPAIAILDRFDLDANPVFRTRIALAWMNRGNLLARLTLDYPHDYRGESIEAYEKAIAILRAGPIVEYPESRRMLAVALSNCSRARVQLYDSGQREHIEKESFETLGLIETAELEDPEMARLMLTTRVTLGFALDQEKADEITDIVEEGLREIQPFTAPYQDPNDELLGQLFWRGAKTYLDHFPQFLTEYLLEFLDPDDGDLHFAFSIGCQEAAVQALWLGISEWKKSGFGSKEEIDKNLNQIGEWQECRDRLASIRNRYFTTEESGDTG